MSLRSKNKEKREPRAGGKTGMEKTKLFNMRVSDQYLAAMSAAAESLGLGKTGLVERALAAFAPEYFVGEGSGVSPDTHSTKYAPQLFERPEGEKKARQRGGQAGAEAKRKHADRRGPNEKI